jgi:hypothetical protein
MNRRYVKMMHKTGLQDGVNEILTEKAKSRLKSNVIRFKDEAETSAARDEDKVEAIAC